MKEEWKWIKGYEGLYSISNLGRMRSHKRIKEGYVLSNKNKYGWYLTVRLYDVAGKVKTTRLHKLVAEAFIGEIPEGYEVHHKDENKQNNVVTNLEIIRRCEHRRLTLEEHPESIKGMVFYNQNIRPKTILQFTKNGDFVAEYLNAKEASKHTGVCARNILQVASKTPFNGKGGVRKQAGGYVWKFKDEKGVVLCS